MYHCHLQFYLTGKPCREFELIKEMPPLKDFTHTFREDVTVEHSAVSAADVIIANLREVKPQAAVHTLLSEKRQDTLLILLAEKDTISSLADCLSQITDIWTLPMTEEEVRFRFLRWQQNCKTDRDYWQTNQYLEATINSMPNMVWFKTKEGLHEHVNDSFCSIVGKTKTQVEGRDHYYIWDVDPEDPANAGLDCQASDNEVMLKQKVCVAEETVKSGDDIRLLTTYKAPLYDWDGSVMGTVGVGIDITQERAYEQEIIQKNHTLETIFKSIDCGVLCHSIDGSRIINVNRAALKILGYDSQEDLIASGFHMVASSVLDEDKPKLRGAIKTLKKKGESIDVEYRVVHKNGDILHVMGNIMLLEEAGELFYRRFLLDCTAQKLQEKEKEHRQRELVQALSIDYNMVCYFDLNTGMGMAIQYDKQYSDLFGNIFAGEISLEESLENYIEKLVYEDDREKVLQAFTRENLKKELENKKVFSVNYRIFIDGKIEYYEMKAVSAGTWKEDYGIVLGLRSVDEVTRNQMEQNRLLENALQQANKASKAKSTFLSNMSHDIRTPMNAIIGYTTLSIAHIDDRVRVEDYLNKIMFSGKHLLNLINDILDMSRIESERLKLEEQPCNLKNILYELKSMLQTDMRDKCLDFEMDMTGLQNENIYCDKLRLNQVLINILSNSVKYTNEGGHISLIVKELPGSSEGFANYEFCIRDTGIGMDHKFLSHIYEPFEREENTTASGIQGTGLGMAITKNVVEMMKGDIDVKSKKGEGTEITVSFTFRINYDTEISEEAPCVISAPVHTGRILLAEDNALNQEIVVAILKDAGFEVEVADNGKEAVEQLTKSEPGYYKIVLMDVQMPVMDGYEATKAIRRLDNPGLANIPILAMTANAFEEDKQKALKCGMNGHIAKPLDVNTLFLVMDKILE